MEIQGYSYETSGFDSFLNRSIDAVPQTSLASAAVSSNQFRFDQAQVSGLLGDTLQIGSVRITKKGILMTDDSGTDILLIGDEDAK